MKNFKISNFIKKNYKYILSKNYKISYQKFKIGKGDLDFIDRDKILRIKFEKLFTKSNLVIMKRYHKTGLRYDIIDKKLNLYSIDFLNGIEINPYLFDFYNKTSKRKIKIKQIKFSFSNFIILFKNIFKHFVWRISSLLKQKPEVIEIFGVDGSGKSYLAKRIFLKVNKSLKVIRLHLWKNTVRIKDKNKIIPYQKKTFSFFFSLLKELFILLKLINLCLKIAFLNKRKCIYLSERSCWDIFIDPERYRLSHKPYLIKFFLKFIMQKSHKILILRDFKFVNSKKGELNLKKYKSLNLKLINFFKKKKVFIKIF